MFTGQSILTSRSVGKAFEAMQTEAVLRSHSNNPIGKRYNDAYALLEKPVPHQQDRPQPVHLVVAAARGPRSLVADQSTEPPRPLKPSRRGQAALPRGLPKDPAEDLKRSSAR